MKRGKSMAYSETKKKIVIRNYFETDCNLDTSIRQAYERGFNRGLEKAPKSNYKSRSEEETIRKIASEIIETIINSKIDMIQASGMRRCLAIIEKHTGIKLT